GPVRVTGEELRRGRPRTWVPERDGGDPPAARPAHPEKPFDKTRPAVSGRRNCGRGCAAAGSRGGAPAPGGDDRVGRGRGGVRGRASYRGPAGRRGVDQRGRARRVGGQVQGPGG